MKRLKRLYVNTASSFVRLDQLCLVAYGKKSWRKSLINMAYGQK